MSYSVTWSDTAKATVRRMGEAMALRNGVSAATDWALGMFLRVENATTFPRAAAKYPLTTDPDTRVVFYRNRYGIIYRVLPDGLYVLDVYDGRGYRPTVS